MYFEVKKINQILKGTFSLKSLLKSDLQYFKYMSDVFNLQKIYFYYTIEVFCFLSISFIIYILFSLICADIALLAPIVSRLSIASTI